MPGTVIYFDLGDTLVFGPAGNKQPFADAVDTIEELWTRGYKIGLLSDQPVGTTEQSVRTKLNDYGLESWRFDVITISSEFDPPVYKPDPQIFAAAAAKAGHPVASSKTVFVTETLGHVLSARSLGWRAIHKPFGEDCTPSSGECIETLSDLLDLFPQLPVDIYIRDAPTDPGDDLFAGANWWNSPDLWIRNQEDGGTSHQNPEFGQDNWFYSRVHNRGEGIARYYALTYTVRPWAGTQFVFPDDYWPYMAQTIGINLEPDQSAIVHAKWNSADVPPAGTHACWLAMANATDDAADAGARVWEHNNLAQKNLTIVDLQPGESGEVAVVLGSRHIKRKQHAILEIWRSKVRMPVEIHLLAKDRLALGKLAREGGDDEAATRDALKFVFRNDARVELIVPGDDQTRLTLAMRSGSAFTLSQRHKPMIEPVQPKLRERVPAILVPDKTEGEKVVFPAARISSIGLTFKPRQVVRVILKIMVSKNTKPGSQLDINLVQRNEDGRIVGGIAVNVNVGSGKAHKFSARPKKNRAVKAKAQTMKGAIT